MWDMDAEGGGRVDIVGICYDEETRHARSHEAGEEEFSYLPVPGPALGPISWQYSLCLVWSLH